jgi:thiamine kinase-like enzyme
MDSSALIATIEQERPFSDYCTIHKITPIFASNARSGQVFFIETTKGKFKLRVCKDAKQASEIEENMRKFSHIFPKFYGRDGRYLLIEALDGFRTLTQDDMKKNMRRIGRMYAEVHLYGKEALHDQKHWFSKRLDRLLERKVISRELYDRTVAAYAASLRAVGDHVALELNDVHKGNFMINDQEVLYFVDEEGIGHRVKGIGIAKFIQQIDGRDWREFVTGYSEVADPSLIRSKALLHHIAIIEPVRSMYAKLDREDQKEKISRDLARLEMAVR